MGFIRKHLIEYVIAIIVYSILNAWSGYPIWWFLAGLIILLCIISIIFKILDDDNDDNNMYFDDWFVR